MVKKILCVVMAAALIMTLLCVSGCGGQKTVKEMLSGEWREATSADSAHLVIRFTEDRFSAGIAVNGEITALMATEGTVEISDSRITLYETNGKRYIYFTYSVDSGTIYLTDYEGERWVRTNG